MSPTSDNGDYQCKVQNGARWYSTDQTERLSLLAWCKYEIQLTNFLHATLQTKYFYSLFMCVVTYISLLQVTISVACESEIAFLYGICGE